MKAIKLPLLLALFTTPGFLAQAQEIDNPPGVAWRSSWNYTQEEFEKKTNENKKDGYRVHDIEVYNQRGNTVYAAIYHKNYDSRGWWAVWRKDYDGLTEAFDKYKDNFRMTDIEVFNEKDKDGVEQLRYSGVWVENREKLGYVAKWNLTPEEWKSEVAKNREAGYRPVDMEMYLFEGDMYFSGIWVENKDNRSWDIVWGVSHEKYQEKFKEMVRKDYQPVDMESFVANGKFYFGGIWVDNREDLAWHARWNLTNKEYDKYSDEFLKKGRRPIDFYSYSKDGETYYGGLWLQNDGRGRKKSTPKAKPLEAPKPKFTFVPSGDESFVPKGRKVPEEGGEKD